MTFKIARLNLILILLTALSNFGNKALAIEPIEDEVEVKNEDTDEQIEQAESHKNYRKRAPKVRDQTNQVEPSATARRSSVAGIAGRLGVFGNKLYSSGIEAYTIVDGHAQYGATLISGSSDVKYSIDNSLFSRLESAKFTSSLIGFQGRWFFGNSFAVGGFGGIEMSSLTYQVGYSSSSAMINGKIEGRSLVAGGFLGNHWSWDNGFTIGCDWFGILLPTSSTYKESSTSQGTPSAADIAIESKAKTYLKDIHSTPGVIAVMFGIGGSF